MKMMRMARRFSLNRRSSWRDACEIDTDKNGTISRNESAKYIEKNAKLWAMLAVNLNLPEQKCRDIATEVAYKLAKKIGKNFQSCPTLDAIDQPDDDDVVLAEQNREPTLKEISRFLDFVQTPSGEQEFFHRTVFETYDRDGNGYLDNDELDGFLNVFYEAGSIFAGDARLPPSKFLLKMEVLVSLDTDGDGRLTFPELRSLISGGARSIPNLSNTNNNRSSNHHSFNNGIPKGSNHHSTNNNHSNSTHNNDNAKQQQRRRLSRSHSNRSNDNSVKQQRRRLSSHSNHSNDNNHTKQRRYSSR